MKIVPTTGSRKCALSEIALVRMTICLENFLVYLVQSSFETILAQNGDLGRFCEFSLVMGVFS